MSEDSLFIGLEVGSGNDVEVPIFHTLITGQTQLSGKSTAQKKLAKLLVNLGYKVLLFDTKENLEDYADFGKEIPVCLRESTDALVLLPLLESVFQRRLPTGYYSVLSEVSSGTKTFEEVIKRAKDMEKSTRSGWKQGACRTLYDLLERLEVQLSKIETVSTLELPYDINRMVLNNFPSASQQLFVKSAFEDMLHIHNHMTISQLDEAYKFIPQDYSSACARAIQDAITQLAITKSYVHLATQYLAPTNKDPLKACAVRLLGTQDHITEAKHTLDLMPFRGIATTDDIMTLSLGHYYVTTKKWAKLTYFLPDGVSKEVGIEVALGKKTSEYVRDSILKKSQVLGDTNLDFKQAWEEEKDKREKLEKRISEEYVTKSAFDTLKEKYDDLSEKVGPLENQVSSLEVEAKQLRKDAEFGRKCKEFFQELLPSAPEAVTTQPLDTTSLNMIVDERLNQRLVKEPQVRVVQVDVDERIRELNKEEFMQPIFKVIKSFSDSVKRAVRYIYEKQELTLGDLYFFLYQQKTGRPPGALKINIITPLEQASFISMKADKIKWAFKDHLKQYIKDEPEVEKIEKYILSLLL